MLAFHSPWLLALCMALAVLAATSFVLAAQRPLRAEWAALTGTALWALPLALYDGQGAPGGWPAWTTWLTAVAAAVLALALAGRPQLTARLGAVGLLLAGSLAGPLLQGPWRGASGTAAWPPPSMTAPMLLAAATALLPALAAALLWPAGSRPQARRPAAIGLLTAALLAAHAALPWPAALPVTGATGWTFPAGIGLEAALLAGLLLLLGAGVWNSVGLRLLRACVQGAGRWAHGPAWTAGAVRAQGAAREPTQALPAPTRWPRSLPRRTRAGLQRLAADLQHCDTDQQAWARVSAAGAELFRAWHGALAMCPRAGGQAVVVAGWGCLGVVRAAASQPLLSDRRRHAAPDVPPPDAAQPAPCRPTLHVPACRPRGAGRPVVACSQIAWPPQRAGVLHLVAHRPVDRAEIRHTVHVAEALGEALQQAMRARQARRCLHSVADPAGAQGPQETTFKHAVERGCAHADRTRATLVLALLELNPAPAPADATAADDRLRDLAERLRARVRADDRVWRLGPSRLALLVGEAPLDSVRRRLDTLYAELAAAGDRSQSPRSHGGAPLAIGLARHSRGAARDLQHRAEVALQAAARTGHPRAVCWNAWSDPRSYVVGLDRASR